MLDPMANRYQEEHRRFLAENRPAVLSVLRQSGNLDSYLSSAGTTAIQRLDHALSQAQADPEIKDLPFG
jgi:hypothetical protein